MNHFVAGILRIVLLEASAALLIMWRLVRAATPVGEARRGPPDEGRSPVIDRRLRIAACVIAGLSLFAFTNFGALRGEGQIVHPWEQAHFFVGSKYLREVGYFDLYKALVLADRETTHRLIKTHQTRDLRTFDVIDLDQALANGEDTRVRARFSDARWAAFKADWVHLGHWPERWADVITDHGNSGSPAWALVALPFVHLFGASAAGQSALGLIDFVLMAILFAFLLRTFGIEGTAVALTLWALTPFCFDYLAGSILRWDWLFAVGMSLAFLKRERPFLAGGFLGYAVVSKVFPLFFGVAIGAWLLIESIRARRLHPQVLRLAAGAAAVAVIFVAASSAVFGFGMWKEYKGRLEVAQAEKYYPNQYSLKTVYLQATESSPSELAVGLFKPTVIKQSLPEVDIANHQVGFLIVQILLTVLAVYALSRTSLLEAFAFGPFLIFIWLTVNAYYWNMLGLVAIVWAVRHLKGRLSVALLGLHVLWAAYYLYQHLAWGFAEGYFVALLLLVMFLATCAQMVRQSPNRVLDDDLG